jgi:alkanesulfonate monooxygenase SsuD/methylene tetrahydromethanopterin reductase-like flavin-dependent oxidoreductase (luciferase family)
MDDIRFGVLVPTGRAQWGEGTDPRELIDFAVRAEGLGYDSLWVNDSLLSPRIEALTMLAAIASVTERATLGTATLIPVLRRPVPAGQALASVDALSGGRLIVAVGAGFPGDGAIPDRRAAHLAGRCRTGGAGPHRPPL